MQVPFIVSKHRRFPSLRNPLALVLVTVCFSSFGLAQQVQVVLDGNATGRGPRSRGMLAYRLRSAAESEWRVPLQWFDDQCHS